MKTKQNSKVKHETHTQKKINGEKRYNPAIKHRVKPKQKQNQIVDFTLECEAKVLRLRSFI